MEAQSEYCRRMLTENKYNRLVLMPDKVFSAFLYEKLAELEAKDIDVEYKYRAEGEPGKCDISTYQLIEMAGILIDNAEEAVKDKTDRRICVEICDRDFWIKAAEESRKFLTKACNINTGLSPEYSSFDGQPYVGEQEIFGKHDWYYSDAYRTIANIGLDYEWFARDTEYGAWCRNNANKLQYFFKNTVKEANRKAYTVDGDILDEDALHPVAITATNAQASLAADGEYALECVRDFWNTPLREGDRRYYDNCLYMFAMLALSGNYRMY